MNNARNILLFLGPPGSGKGTISQQCVQKLGYESLSTGNLCREHIAQQTEIGRKIDLIIKSGKLIDDSLVTGMVTSWLAQNSAVNDMAGRGAVILDGFPRTVLQAELFDAYVQERNGDIPTVIRFGIAHDVVVQRLTMRLICSQKGCQAVYSAIPGATNRPKNIEVCDVCSSPLQKRADDEIEAIRQRLKLYDVHEQNLLDFYQTKQYPIVHIDAQQHVDEVFNTLVSHLERSL